MTEVHLLPSSVEHLHGPEEVSYAEDELVVVCNARNARPYVKSFVEHYFSLGVKHIAFLDNGSTDGTVELLKKYDNVSVLRTLLPFKEYTWAMRQYLIERFGKKDRWCLCVDQDELFDYPYSDVIGLDSFLGYLNSKSYTAVAAQMLDMFPQAPLSGQTGNPDEPLKETYRVYDISNIRRESIKEHPRFRIRNNTLESDEIEFFSGGIRETLFGVRPYLTKHPLVFSDGRVKPFHDSSSHFVDNARIADITGVLFHYKFVGDFREQVEQAVQEGRYHTLRPYKKYLEVLESTPGLLQVKQETSKELGSVNDLLEEGRFLVISEDYLSWVGAQEEKSVLRAAARRGEPRGLTEAFLEARRRERAKILKIQRLESKLLLRAQQTIGKLQNAEQHTHRRELQKAQRQALRLERQLETIEASRTWKLMKVLHRAKIEVLSLGGRSGSS